VRRGRSAERGSILIGALMITFVLTLLGIALFDLTALDARLALGNEADYRALELAQSAIEKTLHQLYLDLCNGNAACTSPPPNPSWADGTINGAAFTVSTGSFADFLGSAASPLAGFSDAVGFGGPGASVTYSSTYFVQLKHLTQTEANNLGIVCSAPAPASPCEDVIYARATANFLTGNVPSASRTIQVIARASFNGFGDGIVAGSPASGSISGNAEIHGSLHVVPCGASPCNPLVFSGGAGIRNNYNGLAAKFQNHIPRLPQIVCAVGTACSGLTVETLNASVRIAKPDAGTVDIGSAAITIGESGSGSTNAVTGVRGKPTMEGVYLGDGCQTANCADQVLNRPQNVFTDRPIRGYDVSPAPSFPLLSDPATVFARTYDDYAACSGPGDCNLSGAVKSGSGNDFFISHAGKIQAATTDDARYTCNALGVCSTSTQNLFNLLSNAGGAVWDDATPNWSYTFVCGGGGVACDDADGARVNGSINGSKPDGFQLEWHQGTQTVSVYKCPVGQSVPCGVPAPTATLALGNVDAATWRYRVTYVNGSGTEFEISPVVNLVNSASNRQIVLRAPVGPPGTETRRLYRFNPADNTWRRVGTFGDNLSLTTVTDNVGSGGGGLGAQPLLPTTLNDGLLSDASLSTLPAMFYIDGQLKICPDCNNRNFFYRGNAAFLVKGVVSDTIASTTKANGSIVIDAGLIACTRNSGGTDCDGSAVDTSHFPTKNLFTFYSAGNIWMGDRSQRDYMGQFYAMGKWTTSKQTNTIGAVTARLFDVTAQVPSFWEVRMPRTPTAFPPRGQRWSIATARWKECVGAVPGGAC
jgi:hypothetical protein